VPFVFPLAMGLRAEDSVLARRVEGALVRRQAEVRRLLEEYDIPLVSGPEAS
jgi:hypothetical protein